MEICRGRFAVFGFSDVICALLVVGAPTRKFHCCRQIIKQFFNDNLPLLPLNLWEGSCCNRSSFELEPLDAHGITQSRLREPWRSGGNFLLVPLKLQNCWRRTDFAMAGDRRRAVARVLKGGSCPYEVVDSSSVYGLRLIPSSKNSRALDEELMPPP